MIVFCLPVAWQLEGLDAARGTDNDRLRAAEKDTQAFFLDCCMKTANDGAVLGAPTLG